MLLVIADEVHLVDGDDGLLDAEKREQKGVAVRLLAHALAGVDQEKGRLARPRPRHHVLEELALARRVDEEIFAPAELQADVAHVDGDTLVALGLESVGHEGPFEGHAAALAHRLDRLDLALGKGTRLVEEAAHEGRFAVIDVPDDDETQGRARAVRGNALAPALAHHMYPSARSRSKASSASWSMARPARSALRVRSSSAMTASMSAASLATGWVMSWSPSER